MQISGHGVGQRTIYPNATTPGVDARARCAVHYFQLAQRFLLAERIPRGSAARLGGEVTFLAGIVATLHIALDEAGNLNFSPRGSKYYVFAAAWTYDPAPLA